MGNPLPEYQRLHIPAQINITPANKGIHPQSNLSGIGSATTSQVYLAQRMRIIEIAAANSNLERNLPVISFVFPI